jgi:hypothetical protein
MKPALTPKQPLNDLFTYWKSVNPNNNGFADQKESFGVIFSFRHEYVCILRIRI